MWQSSLLIRQWHLLGRTWFFIIQEDMDGENTKVSEDENAEVGKDEEYMGVEIIELDTKEECDGT